MQSQLVHGLSLVNSPSNPVWPKLTHQVTQVSKPPWTPIFNLFFLGIHSLEISLEFISQLVSTPVFLDYFFGIFLELVQATRVAPQAVLCIISVQLSLVLVHFFGLITYAQFLISVSLQNFLACLYYSSALRSSLTISLNQPAYCYFGLFV